jgi:hypothetical protein
MLPKTKAAGFRDSKPSVRNAHFDYEGFRLIAFPSQWPWPDLSRPSRFSASFGGLTDGGAGMQRQLSPVAEISWHTLWAAMGHGTTDITRVLKRAPDKHVRIGRKRKWAERRKRRDGP